MLAMCSLPAHGRDGGELEIPDATPVVDDIVTTEGRSDEQEATSQRSSARTNSPTGTSDTTAGSAAAAGRDVTTGSRDRLRLVRRSDRPEADWPHSEVVHAELPPARMGAEARGRVGSVRRDDCRARRDGGRAGRAAAA